LNTINPIVSSIVPYRSSWRMVQPLLVEAFGTMFLIVARDANARVWTSWEK